VLVVMVSVLLLERKGLGLCGDGCSFLCAFVLRRHRRLCLSVRSWVGLCVGFVRVTEISISSKKNSHTPHKDVSPL
jgi:hypothetical protein